MIKIYDTSSLLIIGDKLFSNDEDRILIPSIVLEELEKIKTSANKDQSIKYATRHLLQLLNNNIGKYQVLFYSPYMDNEGLPPNNDAKILNTIKYYIDHLDDWDTKNTIIITNDLSMKILAQDIYGFQVASIKRELDEYTGYLELTMTDAEMADFYTNHDNSIIKAKINQYVNIYNQEGERVDTVCWTGEEFRPLKYKSFYSTQLGDIKPFKGDIYQAMVSDSLMNNKLTMIKGPAGAGKTHLALGFLFHQLEKNKIDKIIIFCNTVATKNSAKLGYYPGTRNEKLLDSQIGNLLSSKLGGKIEVERMIAEELLVLLPMSDIRGYDTSGMNAGIYIPEAQNLDVELLKLAIQRVGEDSFMILDGDIKSQVDLVEYEGSNNGMRRASQVFRGTDLYGEVTLKQIHRSRLAEIAEQM